MVKIDKPIKELRLQVKPANLQDVGKNFARISSNTLAELGINPGDVVEIVGKEENRTTVVAWVAPDDDTKDVIRIDGTVRSNAGTALDEACAERDHRFLLHRWLWLSDGGFARVDSFQRPELIAQGSHGYIPHILGENGY